MQCAILEGRNCALHSVKRQGDSLRDGITQCKVQEGGMRLSCWEFSKI